MHVALLVPVKPLSRAKTRLRGAADGGAGCPQAHTRLVLALARDTLAAAGGAAGVVRAVAVCSDAAVRDALAEDGVETIPDEPAAGLNAAVHHGAAVLRAAHPAAAIAALPGDLPALRPEELAAALRDGLAIGSPVFCSDRSGLGSTLLLAPPGRVLAPRFGPGSAAAHRAAGARELPGCRPGLRCDVDTADDLLVARELGLGHCTRAALALAGH